MNYSLKFSMIKVILDYDNLDRQIWVLNNTCQQTLTVDFIKWTKIVEDFYLE
jgi:hypothetical protein